MKDFHFKEFSVRQSGQVFRVGTDAVLLGSLALVHGARNILEVGTGTGIISLMAAQRNSTAQILAIDIDEEAVHLAQENFSHSPFWERLQAKEADFTLLSAAKKFDLILSNPPYFAANNSEKDVLARQQKTLTFLTLIEEAAQHLSEDGRLSVIIPYESGLYFTQKCKEKHLSLQRKITIHGNADAAPKRLILEFGHSSFSCVEETFLIEKSPRQYSEQYLEATKAFHVFGDGK